MHRVPPCMAARTKHMNGHHPLSSPSSSKDKKPNLLLSTSLLPNSSTKLLLLFFSTFWLLLLLFLLFFPPNKHNNSPYNSFCPPDIAPFYIHTLPPHFNLALLRRCRHLNIYTDMCPHVANRGLGRQLNSFESSSWYATHQFIAEMIFHARAESHPCRVLDPTAARLFYVPFYGGLYASSQFRQPNFTVRDELAVELAEFLVRQPEWRSRSGSDHFLALGRTAWDFMRSSDSAADEFGANRLLLLPAISNMSILTVERHPWQGSNQFGIPYPSYFHPLTPTEMTRWQDSVRRVNRTHLFSFVGGPRVGVEKAEIRKEILRQCAASNRCIRVQCEPGSKSCHEPDRVVEVMKRSEFCMQPPGDSYTRRSVFDSILSGCVPVFFSEHTAYSQYGWYFPGRREEWSVFIGPERSDRIEEELNRISKEEVGRMRERVVEMIPRMTYAHPNASQEEVGFRDAVDVALVELTRRVRSVVQEV